MLLLFQLDAISWRSHCLFFPRSSMTRVSTVYFNHWSIQIMSQTLLSEGDISGELVPLLVKELKSTKERIKHLENELAQVTYFRLLVVTLLNISAGSAIRQRPNLNHCLGVIYTTKIALTRLKERWKYGANVSKTAERRSANFNLGLTRWKRGKDSKRLSLLQLETFLYY